MMRRMMGTIGRAVGRYLSQPVSNIQHGFEYRGVTSDLPGSGYAAIPGSHTLPVAEPDFAAADATPALA
jgi:hypothetical protein